MIVVTAPTGNIGGKVLSLLLKGGEPVRVIARDPSKLMEKTRRAVEVVEGSHGDAKVVMRAFEGARAVFWLPPGNPKAQNVDETYVGFSRPACTAVAARGVRQVVTVSALGRGWPRWAGNVTASLAMDDLFAGSGAALRALACASLMENVLRQSASIRAAGDYHWPTPADLRTRQVASRDVAAAAARLLRDPSWGGSGSVPLLGPEDLTHREMMAVASGVLGKTLRYQEMGLDDLRSMMVGRGASAGMADAMVAMMTAKNEGIDDAVERTAAVTADTPTTFRHWCEEVLTPAVAA